MTWDQAEAVDRQQEMVDKFNEVHDDIEVTLEAYGNDFDTKTSAGMGSGDAPDVMYMWNYPAYHQGLEPLDSYIEKEGADYKDNFYTTLWDYNSIGCYKAVQEAGYKIPEDVSIIGFNDISMAKYLMPPLTTVHIPMDFMVKCSVELLMNRIYDSRDISVSVSVPATLKIRESVSKNR